MSKIVMIALVAAVCIAASLAAPADDLVKGLGEAAKKDQAALIKTLRDAAKAKKMREFVAKHYKGGKDAIEVAIILERVAKNPIALKRHVANLAKNPKAQVTSLLRSAQVMGVRWAAVDSLEKTIGAAAKKDQAAVVKTLSEAAKAKKMRDYVNKNYKGKDKIELAIILEKLAKNPGALKVEVAKLAQNPKAAATNLVRAAEVMGARWRAVDSLEKSIGAAAKKDQNALVKTLADAGKAKKMREFVNKHYKGADKIELAIILERLAKNEKNLKAEVAKLAKNPKAVSTNLVRAAEVMGARWRAINALEKTLGGAAKKDQASLVKSITAAHKANKLRDFVRSFYRGKYTVEVAIKLGELAKNEKALKEEVAKMAKNPKAAATTLYKASEVLGAKWAAAEAKKTAAAIKAATGREY